MMRLPSFVAIAGAMSLIACVPVAEQDMPSAADGAALFAENCAICHGATGQGGPGMGPGLGLGMGPGADAAIPADLTQLSLRNGGSFPRIKVLSTIDGYNRMALGDQRMPEFGGFLTGEPVPVDLGDGGLTPVPRPLAALMTYLESLQVQEK